MADVSSQPDDAGIYWIKDISDEDQPTVFIPGVSREGKPQMVSKEKALCGREKMKSGRGVNIQSKVVAGSHVGMRKKLSVHPTQQPKASVAVFGGTLELCPTAPATATISSPAKSPYLPTVLLTTEQAVCEATQAKSCASLKDLCPEDKRRVANLIQELARMSEEKEETMQKLRDEQVSFERKIQQLEEQNELIVQERSNLQQQYRECQELLKLYQQYLSQQQEKLNESIAQLNQPQFQCKVSSSEGAPARVLGQSGLHGSYLGLSISGERRMPKTIPDTTMATQHPSSTWQGRDTGHTVERGSPDAGSSGTRIRLQDAQPLRLLESVKRQSSEQCWSSHALQTESSDGHMNETGPAECVLMTAVPPVGQESWDMRRHRLLLQKMELELERERLQARLAVQEERLLHQNQWLHQCGLKKTNDLRSVMHIRTPSADLERLSGTAEHPGTTEINKDLTCHASRSFVHLSGAMSASMKDAATSPALARSCFQPMFPSLSASHSPSLHQVKSCRQDSSLTELLEVISPISGWDQARPLNGPDIAAHPESAQEDYGEASIATFSQFLLQPHGMWEEHPEESQLLEEIFFIC